MQCGDEIVIRGTVARIGGGIARVRLAGSGEPYVDIPLGALEAVSPPAPEAAPKTAGPVSAVEDAQDIPTAASDAQPEIEPEGAPQTEPASHLSADAASEVSAALPAP